MPNIRDKEEFLEELIKLTKTKTHGDNAEVISSEKITIDEITESGQGEIYLNISKYVTTSVFFIKIKHQPNHTIGEVPKHNDGIVLKINLEDKAIEVFLFELKKTLRFDNLKTASQQLASAYKFIRYLQLEKCFGLEYKFFIAYKVNRMDRDSDELKNTGYYGKLFEAVYEKKELIPLMIPFCKYENYNFQELKFGSTISI